MRTAQDDARLILSQDPDLSSPRGAAVRLLLHLMEHEKAVQVLSYG